MKNGLKLIGLAFLAMTLSFTNTSKNIIVIDVGHGGKDNGVIVDGFSEKEVTLTIANKIKELNKNPHLEIILTRDTDQFITLEERTKQINEINPDLVISLHANYTKDKSKRGTELFISDYNPQQEKSKKLAQSFLNSMDKETVVLKKANFDVLKNVNCPSILIELGFLSNDKDKTLLTSEEGQVKIANSILNVINPS